MKNKLLLILCLLIINTGVVNANEVVDETNTFSCNNTTYTKVGNVWYKVEKNDKDELVMVGDSININPCEEEKVPDSEEKPTKPGNDGNNTTKPEEPVKEQKPKSSDNSVKSIMIDNDEINLDNLTYTTKKNSVAIKIIASDINASVNYSKSKKLVIGKNEVRFTITAEDGSKKEYKILITREKQSSNTKVTIKVDGNIVKFNKHESPIIYVSYNVKSLDITYILEDKKSNIEIIGNEGLVYGENKIKVKVIAEDDSEEVFTINVYKYEKGEETLNKILAVAIIILFIGAIGYYTAKLVAANRTTK